jgi:predicted AAA+ superfamily ATPase
MNMNYGGFPEPFLKQSERDLRRWRSSRLERLVKEDIRDLGNIRDLSVLQILVGLIPTRVGSLQSLNSSREGLFYVIFERLLSATAKYCRSNSGSRLWN